MSTYLQVTEEEGDEIIELPSEEDGTLLLSTLQAQFPEASGLKYRNPENGVLRGVRLVEGRFHPPDNGWGSGIYVCVFPKATASASTSKRKTNDTSESSASKSRRSDSSFSNNSNTSMNRCSDLIVLGLPWSTNEQQCREYFETFGEVVMTRVMRDERTGRSKGYGFIRFDDYEAQVRVLLQKHVIDGRQCEVRIPNPNSRDSTHGHGHSHGHSHSQSRKVFIGRCSADITVEDLQDYFSQYGEVTDVYIPKPFRRFAFVTFRDAEVAQSLCGEDHVLKGASIHVSNAAPKQENSRYYR